MFYYLAVCAEYGGAQDDGMRDKDDTNQQETVNTEVFKLLPPGPNDLLSLAVTKNLGTSDVQLVVCDLCCNIGSFTSCFGTFESLKGFNLTTRLGSHYFIGSKLDNCGALVPISVPLNSKYSQN